MDTKAIALYRDGTELGISDARIHGVERKRGISFESLWWFSSALS